MVQSLLCHPHHKRKILEGDRLYESRLAMVLKKGLKVTADNHVRITVETGTIYAMKEQ